ncbi:XRE family transcriptional regulator [Blautia obeum]|uniref:XRE family transcriptional regulator n=2 Tax=Blautia obeum TaxID=40520 RepID=A0A3E5ABU7_9FIRM|nr:XRE family transcriptional regulator [Blautia obeum]
MFILYYLYSNIKLRKFRTAHGYTQIELAAVLGISLRTYQRIEYGQQKPNVYVVVRLQRLFQKDISEIMEEYTE